ncbi:hypothetical protein GCM10009808_07670 [Microbacterium sediminicola]|uniref:Coenzyme F420:L-glutamate ligase-like domain-containing protein n=1 Tax=Microbacterium sediminicola TaxID=415210 RepID=A0ABN2HT38_9MICO
MDGAPNEGKRLEISVGGREFDRIPIRTHVIAVGDDLDPVIESYAVPAVETGDWLFVTEKIVAISQGRSYPVSSIHPRRLATFLSRYVTKTSYGIGLGMPETMEMALRECGTVRIVFAAGVSAVTKLFGRSGDFYRVAGERARGIDGPTRGTLPPYNEHVVLVPDKPDAVAAHIKQLIAAHGKNVDVFVVDINDIGGNILGSTASKSVTETLPLILQDNPLGQGHQSTPLGIIRAR